MNVVASVSGSEFLIGCCSSFLFPPFAVKVSVTEFLFKSSIIPKSSCNRRQSAEFVHLVLTWRNEFWNILENKEPSICLGAGRVAGVKNGHGMKWIISAVPDLRYYAVEISSVWYEIKWNRIIYLQSRRSFAIFALVVYKKCDLMHLSIATK